MVNYQKNQALFKQYVPHLADEIENSDISKYGINIEETGINISIDGVMMYDNDNINGSIHKQVDEFLTKQSAYIRPPTMKSNDDIYSKIHVKYNNKILDKSPLYNDQVYYHGYNIDGVVDSLYITLLLGIGNGEYIKYLLESINIKNLYITESDASKLKMSWFTTDWEYIFDYFTRESYMLRIIIPRTINTFDSTFLNILFTKHQFAFNYIPFIKHYQDDYFDTVLNKISDKSQRLLDGWGFFDDEYTSTKHTLENLKHKPKLFRNDKQLPKNSSVFIIGNGPSLDNDIEFIKHNRDKVILISCGTSLKPLEVNGIAPDFHIEMERNIITYDLLVESNKKKYLKNISFIGLNVLTPKVYSLFQDTYMVFRDNDAGSALVNGILPQLNHCNPTAVNMAMSICAHIGVDNIYLFGVDMGTLDTTANHHSKDSIFYVNNNNKGKREKILSTRKMEYIQRTLKSNFEDKNVFTTLTLFWNKTRFEDCISEFPNINYINCSDGAYIEGSKALHSCDIDFETFSNKDETLSIFKDNFRVQDGLLKKQIKVAKKGEYKLFKSVIKHQRYIIKSTTIKSYFDIYKVLDGLFESMVKLINNTYNEDTNAHIALSILRGTIATQLGIIYGHTMATKDKDEAIQFSKDGFEVVDEFLKYAKESIEDIV
jgi:hypothetical protein